MDALSRILAITLAIVYTGSAIYGPYRVGFPPNTEDAYTLYLYFLLIYSLSCASRKFRAIKSARVILQLSIMALCVDYILMSRGYFPEHLPIGLNRLGFAIFLMMVAIFDVGYTLIFHRRGATPGITKSGRATRSNGTEV